MQIKVTCEKHNVSMEVVREWTSRGDIEVTVEPCSECIEEAAQQGVKSDECPECNGTGDTPAGDSTSTDCPACGGSGKC